MNFLRAVLIGSKLLAYVLGVWVIYWLLLKITGHSPTADQILMSYLALMTTLIVAIGGVLFKLVGDVRELKGAFLQHVKHSDATLARIERRLDK